MRAVIQRVSEARVIVEQQVTGAIGKGILVLLGVSPEDDDTDIAWLVKKISQLRIFSDEEEKMNHSVQDVGGEILVISQFTLYGNVKKGNRPSYTRSAPPAIAIPLYEKFLKAMDAAIGSKVEAGIFGAMMEVSLINDGPVTLMLDSRQTNF